MHFALGDERFRQGFRALHLASEIEDDADDLPGTSVGVDDIREAFRLDSGAENSVLARWYNGTEPYDLSRLDSGPVDPGLISINGCIDGAYIVTSRLRKKGFRGDVRAAGMSATYHCLIPSMPVYQSLV